MDNRLNSRRARLLAASSAVVAALLGAGAARAQEAAVIEEVVVTAARRAESVQRVPAAVSALTSEQLETRGIESAADLQFQAPGLQVGRSGGVSTIFIRGVGLNEGSGSTAPGVAVYFDGVYQPHPTVGEIAQMDLERLEVLRGPQGTLYGKNATGGVINFISRAPASEGEGYLQLGYATYEEVSLKGMLNTPITESVRTRLTFSYRDRSEGFVENIGSGPDLDTLKSISGRLRTVIDLSDTVTADVAIYATHEESLPYNSYIYPYGADAIATNPILGQAVLALRPHKTNANVGELLRRNLAGADLRVTWDVGPVKVLSTTSYVRHAWGFSDLDSDTSQLDFLRLSHRELARTFIQQFDLSGTVGPVDWLAGTFYLRDDFHNETPFSTPTGINLGGPVAALPGAAAEVVQDNTSTSYAAYADIAWNLTDELKVIAGGRYSEEEFEVVQSIKLGPLAFMGFPIGDAVVCSGLRTNPEFDSFTWRAGAQYEPNSRTNFYGTVSRGFKSGGVNIGECGDDFEPEKVTSYELGYKARLLEDRLSVGVSLFHYDYTNLQLFQFLPLTTLIQNAPKAEVEGAELEAVFRPDEHWTFNANATLLDAEYGNFESFDDLNRAAGTQNLKGNRLNYSPKAAANLGVEYRTSPLSFGRLTARVDVSRTGKQYFRPFNEPQDAQGAYTVVNLNLVWDSPDERLRARLFVRNATDEKYLSTLGSSGQFGSRYATYGAPRQTGIELRAAF